MTSPGQLSRAVKRSLRSQRGCLVSVFAFLSLVVLALPVGLVRSWQAWRRGDAWRIDWTSPGDGESEQIHLRIELVADIPIRSTGSFPQQLTETVIRIAEHLRQSDDRYHAVYRIASEPDAILLPVGPSLQKLGERLQLSLGQGELAHRTALWLTLPAHQAIATLVDPETYNPEAEGEPLGLVNRSDARWAMAMTWGRIGPSMVHNVVLWIPETSLPTVETLLGRMVEKPQRQNTGRHRTIA